jgi:Ras-related protein Rab-1A
MEKKTKSRLSNEQEPIKIEKLPDSRTDYDKSIKLILLGDSGVGKSSLIDRLKSNSFNITQPATVGLEHHNLIIKINSSIVRVQIWDTAGQEKFDAIASTYYKSADVVIFVYSINIRDSFDRVSQWSKQVDENSSIDEQQIRILIGNKTDLNNERVVSTEEGKDLAKQIGCVHFDEISCMDKTNEKNNNKINNIIEVIGNQIYSIMNKDERANSGSFNYVATASILIDNRKKKCNC